MKLKGVFREHKKGSFTPKGESEALSFNYATVADADNPATDETGQPVPTRIDPLPTDNAKAAFDRSMSAYREGQPVHFQVAAGSGKHQGKLFLLGIIEQPTPEKRG